MTFDIYPLVGEHEIGNLGVISSIPALGSWYKYATHPPNDI